MCLVAVILFFGALAQSKHAAADDANGDPPPQSGSGNGFQQFMPRQPMDPTMALSFLADQRESGKYWIGVECREAQPELRAQLGLKDDEGLVVVHVAEDGPAAKAGLKQHDVIVSAGDTKLNHPPDLVKAVNSADGKELSLKIIRTGKEQTLAVTPAERPQTDSHIIARPGAGFLWPGGGPPVELPDNVSVTIVRQGKQPAKITVTRGDDKWEVDDKDLGKLPEDLRPLVERMVGVGPAAFPFPGGFNMPGMPGMRIEGMQMGGPPGMNPPPRDGNPPHRDGENGPPSSGGEYPGGPHAPMMQPGQILPELMQRLDRLDRRLEMLQDELRRMQDAGPGTPPRMRPRGPGNGPDGAPPNDDRRGGPPPRDGQRGGPPPGDGDLQGPPPGSAGRQPPPNDQ
jgi:hypothetical protein